LLIFNSASPSLAPDSIGQKAFFMPEIAKKQRKTVVQRLKLTDRDAR
jgi:hypothetical protein